MNHHHCHHQCRKEEEAEGCLSCCLWCVVTPLITTGLLAFLNDPNISEKTKNESFIAFWVFVGIDSLIILICIVSLICMCLDIPGCCTECCKKKKEETVTVHNPLRPIVSHLPEISNVSPVAQQGPMIV
jgi:hypothetical protein